MMNGSIPGLQCAEVYGGNLKVDQGLTLPGLDAWLMVEPIGGVSEGGDVLLLSLCDRGMVTKAYLGDVAGHGGEVAPVARALRELVRGHLNDMDHEAFLRALNAEADPEIQAGLFATMAAVSIHRPANRLVYAYAGHPLLLKKERGADEFVSLEPGHCPVPGMPMDLAIGMIPGTAYYQSATPFHPGDLVVLYSDGWLDAPLPGGGRPGLDGLLAVANGASTETAGAFRRDLALGFCEVLRVSTFTDDVSLLVLKRLDQ